MWQNYIGDLARRGARHGVICGAAGAGLGVVAIRELQTGASTFLDSLVFLLLGAGGVVMLARYVPRLANIEETPEIKALANHGTPLAIANAIQSALEVDSRTLSLGRTGTVTLTNSWLVRKRFLGLDLVPLSDVVWVFKRDWRSRSILFGTSRMWLEIAIRTTSGEFTSTCSESQADDFLLEIAKRAPHLFVGFREDLEAMWTDNRNDLLTLSRYRLLAGKATGAPIMDDEGRVS